MDAYPPFRDRDCVDDRPDRNPIAAEHEELAALAAELRALGRRTPQLGPSPAMRAAFRQAVLREAAHRPRKRPFARARGAVLGVAAIAGGGLLIASAASGPNPAMLVVDSVREIRVPVLQQAPRTVPVGSQEARSAGPAPSDEPPMAMAEATPSPESGTRIPAATATPADDPAPPVVLRPAEAADGSRASTPTPTPAHTVRDTMPPRDAADSAAPAEPTPTATRPATSVSAAPTETKRETEPTAVAPSPTPTPTPTPEPKPSDGAIVSDANGKLTPKEPTPATTPPANPGPASDTPGEAEPSMSNTETTKKEGSGTSAR